MVCRAMMAWVLLGWLAVGVLGAGPKEKPAIPPELPPFPLSTQQAKQYQEAAAEFLSEHRDSAHAPLVLNSLVMLAQIARQEDKVLDLRHRLVLQYPRSVPAAHLVAVLEHASDYRKILRVEIDRDPTVLRSKTYAQAFYQAIELGMARWGGAKFLDDEKFMVEAAAAAHLTEQKTAPQFVAFVRAKGKRMTRKVVEAFVDPKTSDAEKLQALYMLDEEAPTAVCLEVLWDRLPDAERKELAPLRARADYLCRNNDLVEVAELLKASAHQDPQLQFWQLWAALGREEEGVVERQLAVMKQAHAFSTWTRQAEEMVQHAGDVEKNVVSHGEVWTNTIKRLRDPHLGVEAEVAMGEDVNGYRFRGYLAVAPRERLFELQLRDVNQLIVAYEASDKAARLYSADDAQITELPAKDIFPGMRWSESDEKRSTTGAPFGFRFEMVNASEYELTAARALVLPQLRSDEQIKATLGSAFASGWLPCPVEKKGARTTATWIRPKPRTGELSKCEFEFDDEGRLRAVRWPAFQVEAIRYIGDKDWRANRPAWPELPVKRLDSFDAQAFIKIMGAFAKVAETVSPKDDDKEDVAGGGRAAK